MGLFNSQFFSEENLCIAQSQIEEISLEDLATRAIVEIVDNEQWVCGMKTLWDLRSIHRIIESKFDKSTFEVAKFYSKYSKKIGKGRRAFLVANECVNDVFRRWEFLSGREYILRTFLNLQDAFDWLGVEYPGKYSLE